MSTSLIVDDRLVAEARVAATIMGKNLNQMVSDYLETVVHQYKADSSFAEFTHLCGQGKYQAWCFNRDELHERT